MSEETKAEVDAAIAAHLADEFEGSFLSHWVVAASGAHPERPAYAQYIFECGAETAHHSAQGLVHLLRQDFDRQFTSDD